MRTWMMTASAVGLTLLTAVPASAGGDWGDYRGYRGREYYSGYLRGDRPYYDAMYYRVPGYYRGPIGVPYIYSYNYGLNPGYRFSRAYVRAGYYDCQVKRRWRNGRYIEKVDCD